MTLENAIIVAAITAFFGIGVQVLLRTADSLKSLREAFFESIRRELQLSEQAAYRGREVILRYCDAKERPSRIEVEKELFDDLWAESQLSALGAEMAIWGLCVRPYLVSAHKFRQRVLELSLDARSQGQCDEAIQAMQEATKKHVAEFSGVFLDIGKRFYGPRAHWRMLRGSMMQNGK